MVVVITVVELGVAVLTDVDFIADNDELIDDNIDEPDFNAETIYEI